MAKSRKATRRRARSVRKPPVAILQVALGKKGIVATIANDAPLEELGAQWMYTIRNRSRWSNDEDQRTRINERARKDLKRLGVRERALDRISDARHVEVQITLGPPGSPLSRLQAAATAFPWEFVLSAATTDAGRADPLLITRLLPHSREIPKDRSKRTNYVFLQSAPGRLDGYYSFRSERERLEAATREPGWAEQGMTRPSVRWNVSNTEPLHRIKHRMQRLRPQVLHVSGIDNHQAVQIADDIYDDAQTKAAKKRRLFLSQQRAGGRRRAAAPAKAEALPPRPPIPDGMVVCGTKQAEVPVSAEQLAEALVPDRLHAPWVVTCNLYYSSARTAVECVRRGAHAAVGFQDQVNDELAELFFQEFYRGWYREGDPSDLPYAFETAWKGLRHRSDELYGTGIVLWLGQSALGGRSKQLMKRADDSEGEVPAAALPTEKQAQVAASLPMGELLQVEVEAPSEINYSLLHNGRPFMDKLALNKLVDFALDQVSVTVDMNVGDGSQPFRHTEPLLDRSQLSLVDAVRLPLTAPLLRSLREGVQSTIYTQVKWKDRIAHESTKAIRLLPVDEWFDDTDQNPWLPSFVLPRDPAVAKIVSVARRHLVTLLDDTTAGFDGYQSVDDSLVEPAEFVDLQVQAIWAALVNDFKLLYINPPPAYSERGQRLRTPSEVIGSNSGTCVDLALLLASCLEYIDVYPVIVLLSGHAFVGYWRNSADHEEFTRVDNLPKSTPMEVGGYTRISSVPLVDEYGWRLASQQLLEVRQYLRRRKLRFLEATGLCFDFSFEEALKEGAANLRDEEEFDSLLDIHLARTASPAVTPLPIIPDAGARR